MENEQFLHNIIERMYGIEDCPALDEYGSKIFGRPIRNSWRLFRYLTRSAQIGSWMWNPGTEVAQYPEDKVPTLDEFATFLLHEVTHGWCHFHNEHTHLGDYPTGVDEEQVCWDVSRIVCEVLDLKYDNRSAEQSHSFHKLVKAGDMQGVEKLMRELPAHHQM